MNTEKLLEKLNALKPLCEYSDVYKALVAEVESDFRKEMSAKSGDSKAYNVVTKMLRTFAKNDTREAFHYAWIDSNNRQCVCDGFRAFRFTEHLPLADRPASAGDPIDLDKIFPTNDALDVDFLPCKLPSVADVKVFIAQEKAKGKKQQEIYYCFGSDKPFVVASYLLDLLTAFPTADTMWYRSEIHPIYVKCSIGDATICPVRTGEDFVDVETTMNARKLHKMMREYRKNIHDDARYSLTPDQFAEMAILESQISA